MPVRVLVLVENLSVPFDRRVWQECRSLLVAGYEVVVVCPQGETVDRAAYERCEGVEIHRYPLSPAKGGTAEYVREYATALWHSRRLVLRLARQRRFDVVHACNPPDLLLLAAQPLRRKGAAFVFDHHDLVPELYLSKFDRGCDLLFWILRGTERLALSLADVVLATNESYRRIAVGRGGKRSEDVFVVRNGPDLARLRPSDADPSLRRGGRYLLAYVGLMGRQDGIDHALRALALLRARRTDWHAVFAGDGDALPEMRALAGSLGLTDAVEFVGRLEDDALRTLLSTCDLGLAPEPATPLNELSTFVKIAEYMAMARPVVAYDLPETRATAGNAAAYAEPNDEASFARRIDELLDDSEGRSRLARAGRARVEELLSWEHSERNLHAAYKRALWHRARRRRAGLTRQLRPEGRFGLGSKWVRG
jgi:glycosyltransferase involved in cell wall biosynthesis